MKKILVALLTGLLAVSLLTGCSVSASGNITEELGLNADTKAAEQSTIEINSAVYDLLDFQDTQEYQNAVKGLIDAPETLEILNKDGDVVWSQKAYGFLNDYEQAPDTVNPSLWENTRNNHAYGLFEVTDGIYQVRGYDMANLTVIRGDTGWIVFDPLMSVECTQAAMDLIEKNLGERPIKAVIISHSHIDHFGGIEGIMTADQAADSNLPIAKQISSGKIPIIVPKGFEEHAVSENIYAGKSMSRRANYQYGLMLEPGITGKLAMGIGMGQSSGLISYISPTYEVEETGETMTIDGIEFQFQMTPGAEAPAEMNTWLPQFRALWLAENCTGTLHNLYTLRGAQVRDGAKWAKYITEAITLYGDEAEITFQSHNWPHWGNDAIRTYMTDTAAVYKFIHDQTLTYINQGYTSDEISNMIQLPAALEKVWYTRQYYGTVAHNAKAVYQKYMGWYDANPANLNPLTPSESAKKWVEYLGDPNEVLRKAKKDFENGEYQWVAEVTNVLIYADPENEAARLLCADALEQLGYQSESGAWRNAYLSAALELRHGNSAASATQYKSTGKLQKNMTASMMFDYMGILLDKDSMANDNFIINVTLSDLKENHVLHIKNGVLLIYENTLSDNPDVSITCSKNGLFLILQNDLSSHPNAVQIEGDVELLNKFMKNLNQFDSIAPADFHIIEP